MVAHGDGSAGASSTAGCRASIAARGARRGDGGYGEPGEHSVGEVRPAGIDDEIQPGIRAGPAPGQQLEVALARLRGARRLRVAAVLLGEPVTLLVVAGPLAVVLSWVTVSALAGPLLGAGTQVTLNALAILAAAVAMAGAVLAMVAASWSTLTRPLADQLRPAARRHRGRWRIGVGEATAVVLAAAGLVELATSGVLRGGRTDPVAAIAPALVTVAAGVIGTRLVQLLCEGLVRPTRDRRWLGWFLAVRQIAYRPTVVRQVLVVALAGGLGAFAVAGWTVANRNWAGAAAFEVGAARVATVSVPAGVDFESAVRRADPSGRYAMAAEQFSSSSGALLAVDATRLQAVAAWPAGLLPGGAGAAARRLLPRTGQPIVVHGDQFRLRAAVTGQVRGSAAALQLTLDDPSGTAHILPARRLAAVSHSYTFALPVGCAGGCALTTIGLTVRAGGTSRAPVMIGVRLSGPAQHTAAGWRSGPAAAVSAASWRTGSAGSLAAPAARGGLALTGSGQLGAVTSLALASRAVPAVIPVIMPAAQAASLGPPGVPVQVEGLDGTDLNVDDQMQVPVLPQFRDAGPMADLTLATRALTSPPTVIYQVWLSAAAPASVLRRLAADHIIVTSIATSARILAGYRHSGPALAYLLFPLAAAAGAILAGLAILFSVLASFRQRAGELAALWSSGVQRAALLRGLVIEQLLVLAFGVAMGVAAGLGSAALALPEVPEFISTARLPPGHYHPPGLALVAVLAGGLLIIGAVAVTCVIQVLRAIRPATLRTSPT